MNIPEDDKSGWNLAFWVLVGPAVLWGACVISIMWGWFMVPLGVPPVGLIHTVGLVLLFGMFTPSSRYGDKTMEQATISILTSAVTSLLMLGICWVVRGLM